MTSAERDGLQAGEFYYFHVNHQKFQIFLFNGIVDGILLLEEVGGHTHPIHWFALHKWSPDYIGYLIHIPIEEVVMLRLAGKL